MRQTHPHSDEVRARADAIAERFMDERFAHSGPAQRLLVAGNRDELKAVLAELLFDALSDAADLKRSEHDQAEH